MTGSAGWAEEAWTQAEKAQLLQLARLTLKTVTAGGPMPEMEARACGAHLQELRGCFVTLTVKGQLRGCIGYIFPQEALALAVVHNARSAAMNDYRFPAVPAEEVPGIEIEISILTQPQPLSFKSPEDLLNKLRPHVDGVVLKGGGRSSTFLPQVWEQLPDKISFLEQLSKKAGGPSHLWKQAGTEVLIYQVVAFKESEMKALGHKHGGPAGKE